MIKCDNCGKNISEYATVCPNCGAKRNTKNNTASNIRKSRSIVKSKMFYKIIVGLSALLLVCCLFVVVCAQNAYNALVGNSVLGLGSIFFDKCVVNQTMQPIVIVEVCAAVFALISIAIIALCAYKHIRSKKQK